MNGLFWERISPYLFALVFTLVWWQFLGSTFPENAVALIGATGTASAVIVGFLVTAKAIVLGLVASEPFRLLVNTKYKGVFFNYLFSAQISRFSLLVISIVGFFLLNKEGSAPFGYMVTWIFFSSLALSLFVRVVLIIFAFLKRAD